ncbi:MAG: uncharacterized protein PWP37_498 [Thermotogota bacterium]|nr:uncharacterized protein [Thermotogota bacterium]MDK2864306.1 uncharacterized protein [Thermotogota bacterium]HCZ05562.1 DUF296 domain-containing protein [Thermotogota bacterium]
MFLSHGDRVIFIRLDHGEDFYAKLYEAVNDLKIHSAVVLSGIGMLMDVELGWFDVQNQRYERKNFSGAYELLSLSGNLSLKDGQPFFHLHVVLSRPGEPAIGGHLFSASVCNTVEIFLSDPGVRLLRAEGKTFRPLVAMEEE